MRIKQLIMISLIFNTLPANAMLNNLNAQLAKKINTSAHAKLRSVINKNYNTHANAELREQLVGFASGIPAGWFGVVVGGVGGSFGIPIISAIPFYVMGEEDLLPFTIPVGGLLGASMLGRTFAYEAGKRPGVAGFAVSAAFVAAIGYKKRAYSADLGYEKYKEIKIKNAIKQ